MSIGGRAVIAVVDDQASVRTGLARLLRSAGYEASQYPSGEDFVRSLATVLPDCLILDLRMPGLDGFGVLAAVRREARSIPVIVLTSFASPEVRERALREGVSVFLEKPAARTELLRAIDHALGTPGSGA
ncbi:MAG: response regulator [marine benthic group bacterium]|jgi:FixJ family two-component response regulator|nr:response regulator [Gemmatimonadota bacterium]